MSQAVFQVSFIQEVYIVFLLQFEYFLVWIRLFLYIQFSVCGICRKVIPSNSKGTIFLEIKVIDIFLVAYMSDKLLI